MHPLVRRVQRLQPIAVFECAARHGSFTAAAHELGMNQSAVSRHIGTLEQLIGQQLFTRSPNRVALNTNGELLLAATQSGFDRIEQAIGAITGTSPTFLLAANPGFAQHWLVPYLDQLQALFGEVDLHLRLFDRDGDLAGDDFDAAVHLAPISSAPLGSRVLFDERVLPIASPDFADSAGLNEQTPPQRLLDVDKLNLDTRDRRWMDWTAWFATTGLTWSPSHARLSYNNYALVMDDAVAGRGVALAWRGLVDRQLETGTLVPVGPEAHRPETAYQVIPSPTSPPHAVDRIADWLVQLID